MGRPVWLAITGTVMKLPGADQTGGKTSGLIHARRRVAVVMSQLLGTGRLLAEA